jgi:hypothetical protein
MPKLDFFQVYVQKKKHKKLRLCDKTIAILCFGFIKGDTTVTKTVLE